MPHSLASATRTPTHSITKPTRNVDLGKLELTIARAVFREEQPGFKFHIKQHPQEVLQVFDELATHMPATEELSHFFVSFEYGIIPTELRDFIETEPSDLLKVMMRNAVDNVIYETLLDVEFNATTLKDVRVPEILAKLKSDCIPFQETQRIPKPAGVLLASMFEQLLCRIEFVSRAVSQTAYDVQPYISHALPTEVGERKEFEHIFHVYDVEWPPLTVNNPCMVTSKNINPELCPYVVVKAYRIRDSKQDQLLGLCGISTPEIMDHKDPYRGFWKNLNTPLMYKLLRTDNRLEAQEMERLSTEAHSHMSREAFQMSPIGHRSTFSSLWRVLEFFYEDGCNPIRILYTLLDSLKKRGDSQQLPNGFTISVCHGSSNPCFGEIYFYSNFVAPETQSHFCLYPHLRTMAEWQRFHTTMWRSPHDCAGGPVLTAHYNPNVQPAFVKHQKLGKVDHELAEYRSVRQAESFDYILQQQQLMKWKHFFTGHVGPLPAIEGGMDQWLAIECAHETAVEDTFLGSNWLHSVNFHFGPNFPKFLIEIWVKDEFCGEYLLPEVSELAKVHKGQDLFRLTDGSTGFTRKDSRKQTAPLEVKGWIYLEATWRLAHPRQGRLSLKLREARNISTKSTREMDTMPGAPQATVWMYDKVEMEWSECLVFTPFDHALYFLDEKHGAKIMQDLWEWEDELMECSEPQWFNYFSWDAPGSLTYEERQVPVKVTGSVPLQRLLHLHNFETRYGRREVGPKIWQLCKNGVPSVMRPYIWVELTGSLLIKAELDRFVGSVYRTEMTAYEYINDCVRSTNASIFSIIEEDLEVFAASRGLEASMTTLIESILKNYTYICSPISKDELQRTKSEKRINIGKYGANLGLPVVYSSRLILIVYYLALDFGMMRFTEEEIFYILLSMTAIKQPKRSLPVAPFLDYFADSKKPLVPTDIPVPFCDAMLLRIAIQIIHPDLYFQCQVAGINIELLFQPIFQSLFAGILPPQSLYRLWDMLLNMLWVAPEVVEIDVTYDELEKLARQQMTQSNKDQFIGPLAMCVRPTGLNTEVDDQDATPDTAVRAHRLLFDGSMGRRILLSFAYSFLLQVLKACPQECTALEIRDAVQIVGASLRDPSEVVRFVERGDFSLFTSRNRINQLQRIHSVELEERRRQLKMSVEQMSFIADVVWPSPLRGAPLCTNYCHMYNADPRVSRYDKWQGVSVQNPGLATQDLKSLIYPIIKFHSLYADPVIRNLPPRTQGRATIQIAHVHFTSIPNTRVKLCLTFDKDLETKTTEHKVITHELDPKTASVFVFNITRPPPYNIKFVIKNEDDTVIARLSNTIPIKKLTTQGSPILLLGPEDFTPEGVVTVHMSYAVYVPTSEMFLPELGGRGLVAAEATLRPGQGIWGDLAVFDPRYVGIDRHKLALERDRFMHSDSVTDLSALPPNDNAPNIIRKFHPLDRPRCFNGFSKIYLESIFYVGFPNFIHCIEDLVCIFGRVKDRSNFQQVLNTNVSMREFLCCLILASNGSVQDKIELLFDLYGHHEPEKMRAQEDLGEYTYLGSNALYYFPISAADAPTPSALKQAAAIRKIERMSCSCEPILPTDCPPEIYEDSRVRMNSISLYSCAAVVHQVLARSSIHAGTLDCINLACQIFDPHARIPRVLVATIQAAEDADVVGRLSDPSALNCMAACSTNTPSKVMQTVQVDVTSEMVEWVARSTAETGWYGLNFFKWYNLKSLDIIDPFPECEKQMTIALTPTGDLADCHSIVLDIDKDGVITGGMGGNYLDLHRRAIPAHLDRVGVVAAKRDDIFFVEGATNLLECCYAFDLHRLVIDKFHFVMAFLSNPILTEILRRPSVFARNFTRQPSLRIAATIDAKFSTSFCDRKLPLMFVNNQTSLPTRKHKKRGDGEYDSDDLVSTSTDTLAHPQDIEADDSTLAYFAKSPIHASVPIEDFGNVKMKIHIVGGRGMHDVETFGRMDPYCVISYGSREFATRAIHAAGSNAKWDESCDFAVDPNNTSFDITVKDKEKIGSDELVGFAKFDFTSMLLNGTTISHQRVPLTYKKTQEGEVELIIEFFGLRKQRGSKGKRSRAVHFTIVAAEDVSKSEGKWRVEALCGGEQVRTRTIRVDENHCTWNEKFELTFQDLPPTLNFFLVSEETIDEDVLGETELKLYHLPKHLQTIKLPLFMRGRDCGYLEVLVQVIKTAEAPVSVALDLANGLAKITILDAENLPTALTSELMAYCSYDFAGNKYKTPFGRGDRDGNVAWLASFQHTLSHWPKKPLLFEINGVSPQQAEVRLGHTEIDLNAVLRQWKARNGDPVTVSQKLDGLAYATGGLLNMEITFVAPPKDVERWKTFRVTVESIRHMQMTERGFLLIRLGSQTVKTQTRLAKEDTQIIRFNQNIDFLYSGEQAIGFEFYDGDQLIGICAYDMWSPLSQGRTSESGELGLQSPDEHEVGKLRVSFAWLEAPPKPWPDVVLVKLEKIQFERVSYRPIKVNVLGSEALTGMVEEIPYDESMTRNPKPHLRMGSNESISIGSAFQLGKTYGVLYYGQPSLWVDCSVSDYEVAQANLALPTLVQSSSLSPLRSAALMLHGVEIGRVSYTTQYCMKPPTVDRCTYVKLSLVSLKALLSQGGSAAPRELFVVIDPGVGEAKLSTRIVPSENTIKFQDVWVHDYHGQPFFRVAVYDADYPQIAWSAADINLWEMMQSKDDVKVQLYQTNSLKGGRLHIKSDFICRPHPPPIAKILRVGFRSGRDLGGHLRQDTIGRRLTPVVRIGCGIDYASPPMARDPQNPVWGDWCSRITLNLDNPHITLELTTEDQRKVLASATLHLWDIFRDPWVEWAGPVTLRADGAPMGVVHIALRLQIPQRIPVFFNRPTDRHPPLQNIRIFPSDTPSDFRRKFVWACREIAEAIHAPGQPKSEKELFYDMIELNGREKVVVLQPDGSYTLLNDKKRFVDMPEIFPEGVVAHGQELPTIDLAIVHITKPIKNEDGSISPSHRPSKRLSHFADLSSPTDAVVQIQGLVSTATDDDDTGYTFFPLGETTLPQSLTIGRNDVALDFVKLTRPLDEFYCHRHLTFERGAKQLFFENGDLIKRLSRRTFEAHPQAEAQLGSLAYASLPLGDLNRFLSKNKIHIFRRTTQWVPAIIHNISPDMFLVSRLSPFESVIGYDYPTYSRTHHATIRDCLPAFHLETDAAKGERMNFFQDVGSPRSTEFISAGAARWRPPLIPRTRSEISEEEKRVSKRGSTSTRKIMARAPKGYRNTLSTYGSSPLYGSRHGFGSPTAYSPPYGGGSPLHSNRSSPRTSFYY
eukprot:Blabericola_migrator_1__8597@NODE_44_length_16877_cov_133_659726_g40_i0_p1_GENE_NODE_44_length_16877_cov_133_659726_g40_i0NODE_44_length_16877_cov_133_659726_g40_i0_p1_ORF_typecomplete_len3288_score670_69C2/PF00168_30/2_6e03C2/PF00168_30/8_3e03C2/PF00168_30/2_1C2/PF00168_30/2_8e14C2/PF00168_30/5_6e06C2/PF00168_30/0_024C2/PF00168_30/31C2/PF00168_30/6_3e02C2/PF00168_30/52RabGAPTBC/PF00566_18/6_7e02RabGAPTBC/PF00566_18/0_00024RPGR1_C/PF18111_1/18RPGR1_C/PF18111_1/5_6e03RPGR1_C/PF18111_1/49RPGR1_C/P